MHGEVKVGGQQLAGSEKNAEEDLFNAKFKHVTTPSLQLTSQQLEDLAKWMSQEEEEVGGEVAPDNHSLPAAYTYFGQLLAHDITAHRFLGSVPPCLRLHTLYGLGASSSPHIYQHDPDPNTGYAFRGVKFFLDTYQLKEDGITQVYDVPRRSLDKTSARPKDRQEAPPNMADARNDQNFILSQLCVMLMRRHNALCDLYYGRNQSAGTIFKHASRHLAHEYQRVILTDYLSRILYNGQACSLLAQEKEIRAMAAQSGSQEYLLEEHDFGGTKLASTDLAGNLIANRGNFLIYTGNQGECRLSEVFARAAMRFGHTQVRQVYQVRDARALRHLFGSYGDLRGFVRDIERKIDWHCLLYEGEYSSNRVVTRAYQPAKGFDHQIVLSLGNLPFLRTEKRNLIKTNLENSAKNFVDGRAFFDTYLTELNKAAKGSLPTAEQALWGESGKKFCDKKLDEINNLVQQTGLSSTDVPLWLFLLLEAEVFSCGQQLGPLGSRLVAEQLVWSLLDDTQSVLYWREEKDDFTDEPSFAQVDPLSLRDWLGKVDFRAKATPLLVVNQRSVRAAHATRAPTAPLTSAAAGNSRFVYTGEETGFEWRNTTKNSALEVALGDTTDQKVNFVSNNNLVERGIRAEALNNGFYVYPGTQTESAILAALANNTLMGEHKRKRQIRVYFSRRMVLSHFLTPDALATELGNKANHEIRGLFLAPVLIKPTSNTKKIELIVRPCGGSGIVASNTNWFRTDSQTMVTGQPTVLTPLINDFIADQFDLLKDAGFDGPLSIPRQALFDLLGYTEVANDLLGVAPNALNVHLITATGAQVIAAENLELAPDDPEKDEIQELPFLLMALESAALVNGTGRAYPNYCYSLESAEGKWK